MLNYFSFKSGTGKKNFYLKTIAFLLLTTILILTVAACDESNNIDKVRQAKNVVQESSNENIDNESNETENELSIEDDHKKQEETIDTAGIPKVEGNLKVHFLDVGQGDSVLIVNGSNAMLIDAGDRGYGSGIVNYLKKQGVERLKYLILTHPHADHIGGAAEVINAFEIEKIIMPKAEHTTKTFENLLVTIRSKGMKITTPVPGDEYELGSSRFKILAPNSSNYESLNDYSVVIRLVFGNTAFLFTGDAESTSESQILSKNFEVKSDVLKVGHHGSASSTSERFLKSVSPKYAVISVGRGNSYGHPTQEVLERLNSYGVKIYRTDEEGIIVATSDGTNITFDKEASTITAGSAPFQPETENKEETVYITKTGSKYHRENCKYLKSSKIPVSLEKAKADGYEPCKVCKP
jgi:competence protein ComEC